MITDFWLFWLKCIFITEFTVIVWFEPVLWLYSPKILWPYTITLTQYILPRENIAFTTNKKSNILQIHTGLFIIVVYPCNNLCNNILIYPYTYLFLHHSFHLLSLMSISNSMNNACWWYSPLTVRCTQLPLWKVSYCCSSISTLHSYQPWSSERTFSIRREDLPCRLARPGRQRRRWGVSRKGHREVSRMGGLNFMKEMKGMKEQVRSEWIKRRERRNAGWMLKRKSTFEQFRYKYAGITKYTAGW